MIQSSGLYSKVSKMSFTTVSCCIAGGWRHWALSRTVGCVANANVAWNRTVKSFGIRMTNYLLLVAEPYDYCIFRHNFVSGRIYIDSKDIPNQVGAIWLTPGALQQPITCCPKLPDSYPPGPTTAKELSKNVFMPTLSPTGYQFFSLCMTQKICRWMSVHLIRLHTMSVEHAPKIWTAHLKAFLYIAYAMRRSRSEILNLASLIFIGQIKCRFWGLKYYKILIIKIFYLRYFYTRTFTVAVRLTKGRTYFYK